MLVIEYKVVSYEYFMDEMREWEKWMLVECCDLAKKHEWLWFRYNTWATLQAGGCFRRGMTPEKWMPLKYDPKVGNELDEDIKFVEAQLKNTFDIEKMLNNKGT